MNRLTEEDAKDIWEDLDHLVSSLPSDGPRQQFRRLLFMMTSNAVTDEAQETRDLVRRWLAKNDPDRGYRIK